MPSKILILKFNNTRPELRKRDAGPKLTHVPKRYVLRFRHPDTATQG